MAIHGFEGTAARGECLRRPERDLIGQVVLSPVELAGGVLRRRPTGSVARALASGNAVVTRWATDHHRHERHCRPCRDVGMRRGKCAHLDG
jgi:hypothetical protein